MSLNNTCIESLKRNSIELPNGMLDVSEAAKLKSNEISLGLTSAVRYCPDPVRLLEPSVKKLDEIVYRSNRDNVEYPFFFFEHNGEVEITDIGTMGKSDSCTVLYHQAKKIRSRKDDILSKRIGFGHTHTSGLPGPSDMDLENTQTVIDNPNIIGIDGANSSNLSMIIGIESGLISAFNQRYRRFRGWVVTYRPIEMV